MSRGVRRLLIFLLVFAALFAVLTFGFRIRTVVIQGNSRYSVSQIQEDLIHDRLTENTLYFSWKYRTAGPSEDAPYLTSVRAQMASPTTVKVTVTESTLTGRVQYNGQNVYFDENGIVQMITSEVYDSIPLITGVTVEEPVLYQKLTLDNAATLRTMLSITQLLIQADFIPDSVTFDESGNMTLRFGAITVSLGQDEYLEEKISNLLQIYPKIEGRSGTLNMEGFTGKGENITFQEDSASETQTESGAAGGEAVAGIGADTSGTAETDSQDASGGNAADTPADSTADTPADTSADTTADTTADTAADSSSDDSADENTDGQLTAGNGIMAFDSSGNLHYDARIVNGEVVDANGNPIEGCTVNESGHIVDGYWNELDPDTGEKLN